VSESRPPATLVNAEDALAEASDFVDELNRRYDLRIVHAPSGAFIRRRTVLLHELSILLELLVSRHVYRRDNLLIAGSHPYAVLAASRVTAALRRRPRTFVYNFYLHDPGENELVQGVLRWLFTDRVVIAAQSPVDLDYFRSLADRTRLVLVPYGQDPVTGVSEADVQLGDYVFAGGYTNRNYDRVLRCARQVSSVPFVIACSSLNTLSEPVPENVDVQRDLEPERFHKLLAGARLVVIPLADDLGSSGQMVTLASMQLGKAVIAGNSRVVTQYFEEGVSGLAYDLTSDASLRDTIASVVEDERRLLELGAAARARYEERSTKSRYHRNLLDALEKAFPATPTTS
jgi:glycosyltransferase involved in cell wall biosynthesis